MRVSAIDSNGDWTFGKSKANYKTNADAIRQNVVTRLRSFVDDWFLDVNHGVDWYTLLGSLGNENRILRAIERTVLQTEGVVSIEQLAVTQQNKTKRTATIDVRYTDVFDIEQQISESIT